MFNIFNILISLCFLLNLSLSAKIVELNIETTQNLTIRDALTKVETAIGNRPLACIVDDRYDDLSITNDTIYQAIYYIDGLMIPKSRAEFLIPETKVSFEDDFCKEAQNGELVKLSLSENGSKKISRIEGESFQHNLDIPLFNTNWYPAIINIINKTNYDMNVYFKGDDYKVVNNTILNLYISHPNELADISIDHKNPGLIYASDKTISSTIIINNLLNLIENNDEISFFNLEVYGDKFDIKKQNKVILKFYNKLDLSKDLLIYNHADSLSVLQILKNAKEKMEDINVHGHEFTEFFDSLCPDSSCEVKEWASDVKEFYYNENNYRLPKKWLGYPAVLKFTNERNNDLFINYKEKEYIVKKNGNVELYIYHESELKNLKITYNTGISKYISLVSGYTYSGKDIIDILKKKKPQNCDDPNNICKLEFNIKSKNNLYRLNLNDNVESINISDMRLDKFSLMRLILQYKNAPNKDLMEEALEQFPVSIEQAYDIFNTLKNAGNNRLLLNYLDAVKRFKEIKEGFRSDLNLIVIGDQGKVDNHSKAVAYGLREVCNRITCDFGISVGDNVYPKGPNYSEDGKWALKLKTYFNDLYEPLLQIHKIPFYIALGNHDIGFTNIFDPIIKPYITSNFTSDVESKIKAQILYTQNELNENQVWNMNDSHYSVIKEGPFNPARGTSGTKAFIAVIDTNHFPESFDKQKSQLEWLNEQLSSEEAKSADHRIVVGHHALVSSGKHGNPRTVYGAQYMVSLAKLYGKEISNPANIEVEFSNKLKDVILPLMCENNVNLYLAGHDHMLSVDRLDCSPYEDKKLPAITQILSGAAAKSDGHSLKEKWLKNETKWLNGIDVRGGFKDEAKQDLYGFFSLRLYGKGAYEIEAYEAKPDDIELVAHIFGNAQDKDLYFSKP